MDSSSSSSSPQTVEQISEVVSMLSIPSEIRKDLKEHTDMPLIGNNLQSKTKDNMSKSRNPITNQKKRKVDPHLKDSSSDLENETKTSNKKHKKNTLEIKTPKNNTPLTSALLSPSTPRPRGRPRKYPRPEDACKAILPSLLTKKKLLDKKETPLALVKKLPEPIFKKFNLVADTGIKEGQFSPFLYMEPFIRPEGHYLRATESIPDSKLLIEYDLDLEDKAWLEQLNDDTPLEKLPPEIPNAFEFIIDNLEKEWFELSRKVSSQHQSSSINTDVPCDICGEIDCENSNAIVFCDGCDLAVHQDCYGVPYIPEGQWLCRKCMLSPAYPVECVFCPNEGGAFKQTSNNNWAHLTCALWIPEVSFGNLVYMEPIEGVSRVPKSRRKLLCYICKQPSGACIQCSHKSCMHPFHATCARAAKLYMKYKATENGVSMKSFCHKHTPKGHKHEINIEETQEKYAQKYSVATKNRSKRNGDSDSDSDQEAVSKSARAHKQSFLTAEAVIPRPIFQKVLKSLVKFKIRKPSHFLGEVCKYWSLKKEDCRNAPLIKRLHLEPWTALPSSLQTEEEKLSVYGTLIKVRSDLEKVRMLIDLVRKREACKLNIIRTQFQYWETNFFPQVRYFRLVLERMIKLDTYEYFTQAVTKEQAPDYLEFVKNPMDLGTLTKLVNSHQVVMLDDFKEKLLLIYSNCIFYNNKGTIYHKAAMRHQKRAHQLLAIISQALNAMETLSPEVIAQRFDTERSFGEAVSKKAPATPPKQTISKRTPEKVREASPPLTRSKKRYFESYDFRKKSHPKLKSHLDKHKKTRQTTLTSPSNRLKLYKKHPVALPQRTPRSSTAAPSKQIQTSILSFVSREKTKRSPRKSQPPERFSP